MGRRTKLSRWCKLLQGKLNDISESLECVKEYGGEDDIDWLIGDIEDMLKYAKATKKTITSADI